MANVPVMFQMQDTLLAKLDAWCLANKVSRAHAMRLGVARLIGVNDADLVARQTKYPNPEERLKATKERNRQKRQAVKELIAAVRRGDRQEDIQYLAATLGIKPEDI